MWQRIMVFIPLTGPQDQAIASAPSPISLGAVVGGRLIHEYLRLSDQRNEMAEDDGFVPLEGAPIVRVSPNAPTGGDRDLFGHPRGLLILAGTEFWERFSFYGMQSLLVLYMVEYLLLPGHIERIYGFSSLRRAIEAIVGPLSIRALSTQIFGLYAGLVYLTPIFGGLLGDRWMGRRRSVALGALLMMVGHFCMAVDRWFLLALLALLLGAGCLRGNLISQVGDLYSKEDRRRADGFQIYYIALVGGAFLAPLLTGVLAQLYHWRYAFVFAGFGMLVGLVIYLAGGRYAPPDLARRSTRWGMRLEPSDRRVVVALCLMLPLLTLFWIAQTQVWNTYNLWARDHLNRSIAGLTVPVAWFQAISALTVIALATPVISLWRWQARHGREPDDFAKLAIGSLIFALAMAWLAGGSLYTDVAGKVPLVWALLFHVVNALGYLYVSPIAAALFSRAAPAAINATMLSVYYLSIFAGSILSGRLGALYERIPASQFWLLHGAIVGSAGLLFVLFAPRLRRALAAPR
jgi:POT family proton-dependent oligopeptide transporter